MSPKSSPKASSARKHATTVTKNKSEYVVYKNPSYAGKVEAKRKRWKPLKQIIDGIMNSKNDTIVNAENEEMLKQQPSKKKRKSDKPPSSPSQTQISNDASIERENYVTIAAAPSTHPPLHHYCDITGLPTKYHDPKTGLYYKDASVFAFIRASSTQRVQQFLGLRNAGVNI